MSTPSPIRYFGGSTVLDGRVRILQAKNFKELVEQYVNVPVAFPLTRKQFNLLSEDDRNRQKDCPFICAASYAFDEGKREDDTATHVTCAILDFDEGAFVKDFFESPETIGEHLYPINFAAWTTAKHTPDAPRLKVMVDLSPMHPSQHRRVIAYLIGRLGVPRDFKGVRESNVLSQPQYRPLAFKDETFSAVLASRVNGIALSEADLPPLEETEFEVIDGDRVYACDRGDDFEHLGLAFLPLAGITVEDIREPLFTISADCSYKLWYEVCAALRHQFVEEDEARQAYDMFVEWSAQSHEKFKGEKDTYTKWKSFRPYAKGRAPVTLRSLFMNAAKLGGWKPAKVTAKLKQSAIEWITACTDPDELMTEGAKVIATMPFINGVVEQVLIATWAKKLKELSGTTFKDAELKKEIRSARKREQAEKDALREDQTPGWVRPMYYIAGTNLLRNTGTGSDYTPVAFDNMFSAELMPKDGGETPANGKPVMTPSAYALNILKIPRVDQTIYYPLHDKDDPIYTDPKTGKMFLNTYNKFSAPIPDPNHSAKAMAMLYDLVRGMIAEEWLVELFIDFFCFAIQNPGVKIRWSFLIQSAEGAGKGYFGKVIRAVMGALNVRVVSPEVLRSQWNDWSMEALLLILEEIHIPGEQRERVTNGIKQLITDDVITINKRNTHAQCDVPNFANIIGFTNYKDALHLKEAARRWCVVFSRLQTKKQVEALTDSGHFDRLEWLITDEGAAGLRYAMLTRKIPDSFPVNGPAPHTEYRDAVVEESKNSVQVALEAAIADDDQVLVGKDLIFGPEAENAILFKDRGRALHYLGVLGYQQAGTVKLACGTSGIVWINKDEYTFDHHNYGEIFAKRMEMKDFDI